MSPTLHRRALELSQQLATELVFAKPGSDAGLLPVNCLLGQLEQALTGTPAPGVLLESVKLARRSIEDLFAGDATFNPPTLSQLQQWTSWFEHALIETEQGRPVTAFPSASPGTPQPQTGHPPAGATPGQSNEAQSPQEPALVLDAAADGELLREFLNESAEHLQNIEQGVLILEENPTDAETLNSIFRAFHTFKGGAGFLNLEAIQTLAHDLESLLDLARTGKLRITSPIADIILTGGDILRRFTVEIDAQLTGKTPPGPIRISTRPLLEQVRSILANPQASGPAPAPAPAPTPAFQPPLQADPESPPSHPDLVKAALPTVPEATPPTPPTPLVPSVPLAPLAPAGDPRAASPASSIKVDPSKLDSLVDLVGELVITHSQVVQNRRVTDSGDEHLNRNLAQLARVTKELQRIATSLRMVPIRSTFQKMNRLVRDIAAKTGKQVELVTEGEETEIDRSIVEEISDPLIHMIRNAVDHGIEAPDLRTQRGKPSRGTITLKAYHQGGNIVIEISDDGKGLDTARIFAKAVQQGILAPDASLSEDEIFQLIFAAGFSTAEQVTDLSGRGVGMDVVRRNIEKLRGTVEIQSTPGSGSTFRIHLPLTLAIIDGLILGVGEERFILPTLSVHESFRPEPGMVHTVQGRGEAIRVRGRLRPVLRLGRHLGVESTTDDPTQSIAVLVEAGRDCRCILVDRLIGKQEVVIKTLGDTFKRSSSFSGAAILGDGKVGLILDPNALVHPNEDVHSQAA